MSTTQTPKSRRRLPVMRTTSYDKASSGMISTVVAMGILLGMLVLVWLSVRIAPPPPAVPVELVEMPGGYEDGDPTGTGEFSLESTDIEVPDPSITEQPDIETQITDIVETVENTTSVDPLDFAINSQSGKQGSPGGNGKRPLGVGGGGKGGIPREDRWVVRFDESTLDEYAKQLDFFKVELGALFSGGRLVLINNVSATPPAKREIGSGRGENRLYMKWRAGGRNEIDSKLFQKAGVNTEGATILHFYSPETEQLLAQVETSYRNRKSTEIRKTYFAVRKEGNGYRFAVTSQSYLR